MEFSGKNNNDVFKMNQASLLHLIQRNKICSRAELSKHTGLTQAAITKIVSKLISYDVIQEVGLLTSPKGRHAIALQINENCYSILAVKIARDSVMIGLFSIGGTLIHQETLFDNLSCGPDKVLAEIRKHIFHYLNGNTNHRIVAIGVAVAGPYMKFPDKLSFLTGYENWNSIHIRKLLQEGVPIPLFVEHDAKAGAYAEWLFGGVPDDTQVLATIHLNEGLGAGIISKGILLEGSQGIASEIGHISVDIHGKRCRCGNFGCLEMYCSTTAAVRQAKALLPKYPENPLARRIPLTFNNIVARYQEGCPLSAKVMDNLADGVCSAILILIRAYNPDHIILCDKLQICGDAFIRLVSQKLRERTTDDILDNLTLRYSTLDIDACLYGAAAVAIHEFLMDPRQYLETK